MNYIIELNAFWKFVKTNPISSNAMLLYNVILQLHNTAGWKRKINISNKTLEAILGVSEKTLIKHRKILIENGLLIYTSRQRCKASGEYTLLSFELGEVGKIKSIGQTAGTNTVDGNAEHTEELEIPGNSTEDCLVELPADSSDLLKENDTKSINYIIGKTKDENLNYLLKICKQNKMEIDDKTQKWLLKLIEHFEISWIQEAIRVASKKKKLNNRYVEGILLNWKEDGKITTFSNNTNNTENKKNISKAIKTRFHNFEQRSDNYSAKELDDIAQKKRQKYSDKLKKDKDDLDFGAL